MNESDTKISNLTIKKVDHLCHVDSYFTWISRVYES